MDSETLTIIRKSIEDWCKANATLIEALEASQEEASIEGPSIEGQAQHKALGVELFKELDALGLLHILFHEDSRSDIALVAEAAYQFALFSPSIAVRLVQQNMATFLFAEAGMSAPEGWVALPLYDAVVEWPFHLAYRQNGVNKALTGKWTVIPLLPEASVLLLPVHDHNDHDFKLLSLDVGQLSTESSGPMLGLRGCSYGDLFLNNVDINDNQMILQGQGALNRIDQLWSHAEVCMMAIRSGIYERSYSVAKDYAEARWQGGKNIVEHSHVRRMLADLYQEKCALLESWQSIAAALVPEKKLSDGQMGIALNSGERLPWATSDGIQLLGGNGYMEDYSQARCFRDAKQCESLLGHPQARSFLTWEAQVS